MTHAIKVAKNSFDAKNYYSATIKLAEAYLRLNQSAVVEKAIFMLESIFPKVLIMKSKHLESDLYLTYAKALDAHSMFRKWFCLENATTRLTWLLAETEHVILEYVEKAEQGKKDQIL